FHTDGGPGRERNRALARRMEGLAQKPARATRLVSPSGRDCLPGQGWKPSRELPAPVQRYLRGLCACVTLESKRRRCLRGQGHCDPRCVAGYFNRNRRQLRPVFSIWNLRLRICKCSRNIAHVRTLAGAELQSLQGDDAQRVLSDESRLPGAAQRRKNRSLLGKLGLGEYGIDDRHWDI